MSEAKETQSLKIFKGDHFVGHLERTLKGCRIVFDESYYSAHAGQRFTYNINISNKVLDFQGLNLPPYFAGLLPEGLRLKHLVRRLKTSEDDMFSLLVASGANPVGDIYFQNSTEDGEPLLALPHRFSDIRARLKEGEDPGNSSLAGVQEKISADRISLPLTGKKRNKSYILKLESTEFPQGIQNEFLCMKIAKACGLNVNAATIVRDEEKVEALLVERFDREWDKNEKKWHRYHQEDACQFLDRYPADKYRLTMQEIADGLGKLTTTPEIETLQLLKLTAFSYLIGNGDLHGKNISLIEKKGITQLTPCYDILCTALYGDHKMALFMDGKNQNWKRKLFTEFGARYGVAQEATHSMLNALVKKFAIQKEQLFELPLAQEKKVFLMGLFQERLSHLA